MSGGAQSSVAPASGAAPARFTAVARTEPEDFRVDELHAGAVGPPAASPVSGDSAFDAPVLDGEGEHLWLQVRKRLANTADVADALASAFGVPARAVGWAGLKDRRAVTTQWFSVLTTGAKRVEAGAGAEALVAATNGGGALGEGRWEVLRAARHSRKLRRGAHAGNRFTLVLRELEWRAGGDAAALATLAALAERVAELRAHGFPNRFGDQRFGRDGRNVDKARALFARAAADASGRGAARGRRGAGPTRTARGLLLSAARSAIFNAVLEERVRRGDWNRLLDGEPAMLAGGNAFFVPVGQERFALAERLASGDVSPSGPLHGDGASGASGECAALEAAVVAGSDVLADLAAGLEAERMDAARRALVARAPDLVARVAGGGGIEAGGPDGSAEDVLTLSFTLAPGIYATALLDALGEVRQFGA